MTNDENWQNVKKKKEKMLKVGEKITKIDKNWQNSQKMTKMLNFGGNLKQNDKNELLTF